MVAQFPLKTRIKLIISKVCAYGLNTVLITVLLAGLGLLIWGSIFGLDSGGLMTGVPDGPERRAAW